MSELVQKYGELISDLKEILTQVQTQAETALKQILTKSYWEIGQRINQEKIGSDQSAFLIQIANEINVPNSTLSRAVQFYNLWPDACPTDQFPHLNWTHYRTLITVPAKDQRQQLLEDCAGNRWSARQLQTKIRQNTIAKRYEQDFSTPGQKLPPLKKSLHVYKAEVLRVIDGDTLAVSLDLGFSVWTKQKLRLRGIDTAELKDADEGRRKKGEAAKTFVEERLPAGSTLVLQTEREDLHGRYVADVYYLEGETDKEFIFEKGVFLNQELLDEELARLY